MDAGVCLWLVACGSVSGRVSLSLGRSATDGGGAIHDRRSGTSEQGTEQTCRGVQGNPPLPLAAAVHCVSTGGVGHRMDWGGLGGVRLECVRLRVEERLTRQVVVMALWLGWWPAVPLRLQQMRTDGVSVTRIGRRRAQFDKR
ncbi:hypothetical protein BGZ61DRAFT_439666 [Ilyonectria robusta]|uniref:uncharacterized protein n=1 Tax=Ilyonectria robusta TaxID=1079257 RepID=UPI001E8E236B|nr:uncharacterized protein BGZ61DRAFT_439666 [Ilyonectria robusta]KAH8738149.1 hypothetical protein BGZ61DRAFT_439666 [Ilyonectria robusta]